MAGKPKPDIAVVILAYEDEFKATFGQPLRRFMSSFTGFDVFKFDELIRPRKTESTNEAVERMHGAKAVKLVRAIILSRLPTGRVEPTATSRGTGDNDGAIP